MEVHAAMNCLVKVTSGQADVTLKMNCDQKK